MLSMGESGERSYESFKQERFNAYKKRIQSLVDNVYDTSLKFEDKQKLLKNIIEIAESKLKLTKKTNY